MKKKKTTYCFFALYEKFIRDSQTGRRLQPNGKQLTKGTIENYVTTKNLLEQFCQKKSFLLRIIPEKALTKRETEVERNYWKKFYRRFTDYLYADLGHFDNYVGATIKNLKIFFNYLNRDQGLGVGLYYKQFYVRKEEIAIYPLMPEELNYLIYNKAFEDKLSTRMKEVKDVFVFGCTVALRVSDLLKLKRTALQTINGQSYLSVVAQKTNVPTRVKLPSFAVDILQKYRKRRRWLLPHFNASNLNKYIKQLLFEAGFVHPVSLSRLRRGRPIALTNGSMRFCDIASTHTMRRTAITTMLCLGMPEQVVRKISGHAPGTKEFYRYVQWAQSYQDNELEKVFQLLKEKTLHYEGLKTN